MVEINNKTFSGSSKVFDGTLAATLIQLAQNQAAMLVQGEGDLTDNSAGTAGSAPYTIANGVSSASLAAYQGTSALAKTEGDSALGNVADAIATLVEKLDAIHDAGLPFGPFVDNTGATAGSGTIAAIDISFTPTNGAGSMDYASFAVIAANIDNVMSQLAHHVDRLMLATGGTRLVNSAATPLASFSKTFAAIDATSDTGVDGTAADSVQASVADALFTEWADNVAKMAAAITEVTTDIAAFPGSSVLVTD